MRRSVLVLMPEAVNRGGQFGNVDWARGRVSAVVVAGADDGAARYAAAGEHGRAALRPVVAAAVGIDARRAAELAHDDDQRPGQQRAARMGRCHLQETLWSPLPPGGVNVFSIDFSHRSGQDEHMETAKLPPDVLADMKKAIEIAMTGLRDPEFEKRIHDEGRRIREEIFRKHGLLDIAVPAIRELRDSE